MSGAGSSISTVQGCTYGFVHSAPVLCAPGSVWAAKAQKPFRSYWVWAWGDARALVEAIELDGENQLVGELPFESLDRGVPPEQWLAYVGWSGARGLGDTLNLVGTPVKSDILHGFGWPAIQLPAIPVGGEIALRYRGLVRGLALVGIQIP